MCQYHMLVRLPQWHVAAMAVVAACVLLMGSVRLEHFPAAAAAPAGWTESNKFNEAWLISLTGHILEVFYRSQTRCRVRPEYSPETDLKREIKFTGPYYKRADASGNGLYYIRFKATLSVCKGAFDLYSLVDHRDTGSTVLRVSEQPFAFSWVAAPWMAPVGGRNPDMRYTGPKLFVGGAFKPLMAAMLGQKIENGVGFHMHSSGFDTMLKAGTAGKLLDNFATKQYLYEADLNDWSSSPALAAAPGLWGNKLNEVRGGWRCAVFVAWATSADMAAVGPAAQKFAALFQKVRKWGCQQCWISWAPPSVPAYNAEVMKRQAWVEICQTSGANGIMIDHPAQRTDCLDVSLAALKWAQANGRGSAWLLNGSASAKEISVLIKTLAKSSLGPLDFISTANHNSVTQGTGWRPARVELTAARAGV